MPGNNNPMKAAAWSIHHNMRIEYVITQHKSLVVGNNILWDTYNIFIRIYIGTSSDLLNNLVNLMHTSAVVIPGSPQDRA